MQILRHKLMDDLIGISGKEALFKFADTVREFLLSDRALSSIVYHLNEYPKDAEISQEIFNLIKLGEKLNFRKESVISFHALIGAVLSYVFRQFIFFVDETKDESNRDYHEMILRLRTRADLQN